MPTFVQSFSATQVLGLPSKIYLQDTSTGSDVAVTGRKVYITNAAGEYLVAGAVPSVASAYTTWDIGSLTTNIDVLTTDMALFVRVDWVNVSGTVLYTNTTLYGFYQYTQTFLLTLTKNQVVNPQILNDANYWEDKSKLHTLLKDAENAVSVGGDIYSAQNSLDLATYLMSKSQFFY